MEAKYLLWQHPLRFSLRFSEVRYTYVFEGVNFARPAGDVFMRHHRLIAVIAAIIAAIVILGAFASMRRGEVLIRADHAVRAPIASSITTNGKIEPIDNFEAHAPAPSTIKRVLVREGDHVKRGQLLVQLDDADARAQAARALARLKAAEADLLAVRSGGTHEEVLTNRSDLVKARNERDAAQRNLDAMRRLEQRGAASPAEVEAAQARLQTAQAQLSLLEQKTTGGRYSGSEVEKVTAAQEQARAEYQAAEDVVHAANVTAPRDGIVYSVPVRPGAFVNTGELLVQVADLRTMQVRAFIDEPDIGRLAVDEPVSITWEGQPGRSWQGRVTRMPSTVTVHGSRTVGEVTCDVANDDLKLLPNINVNVTIITAKRDNALLVPREAVHQNDSRKYLYEVVNGELQRRYVETGVSDLTRIEITSGIKDDSLVALGAIRGQILKDGMEVRVVQQ